MGIQPAKIAPRGLLRPDTRKSPATLLLAAPPTRAARPPAVGQFLRSQSTACVGSTTIEPPDGSSRRPSDCTGTGWRNDYPLSDASEIARLMGLPSWRKMSDLSLVDQAERGLPLQTVERVAQVMAPDDPARSSPCCPAQRGPASRKQPHQHLTGEASERVHGIARVLVEARRLWADNESAMVRFLNRPHLLLGGRTPLDVARQSTTGADLVVRIIGEARASVAV